MKRLQRLGRRRLIAPLLIVSALVAASLAGQSLGSISGTLAGDDGKPLAAQITANGVPPLRSSGSAKSSANGSFTISNLSPGAYNLCAETGGAGYLDPCAWEPIPITAQIGAGQAVTGYRLIAKLGTPLQVRINDPAGILSATAVVPLPVGQAPPSLLVGVFSARGLFQLLVTTSVDATGSNRQVTVPQNAKAQLYVSGQGVQITNGTGAAVNPSGTVSAVTPNGTITFTLSAKP